MIARNARLSCLPVPLGSILGASTISQQEAGSIRHMIHNPSYWLALMSNNLAKTSSGIFWRTCSHVCNSTEDTPKRPAKAS
jgi:hypothetical protein